MSISIPKKMRALRLNSFQQSPDDIANSLEVIETSVPELKRGQVLIRIEVASCNPSDIGIMKNSYGFSKTLPTIPGMEASGEVVASGGGWMANWLVGQRVACASQADEPGTWAQYFVANANFCIPLKKNISFEVGAGLIVNPLAALGLLAQIEGGGHRAVVQSAAASSLGKMLIALAQPSKFKLINIVRRPEQAEMLKKLGAEFVISSADADFKEKLKEVCKKHQVTIGIEAVGGEMTGLMLECLTPGSELLVYGSLSFEACRDIRPQDLVFEQKHIRGFWLTPWLGRQGLIRTLMLSNKAQQLLGNKTFVSDIRARVSLQDFPRILPEYMKNMSVGKLLILPNS